MIGFRQIHIVHLSGDDDRHIHCLDRRTGEVLAMEIVPHDADSYPALDEHGGRDIEGTNPLVSALGSVIGRVPFMAPT